MLLVILGSGISMAIGVLMTDHWDCKGVICKVITTLLNAVLAIIVGFAVSFIVSIMIASIFKPDQNEAEKVILSEKEIVSLSDNPSINGQFFIGTGYIDGTMKYVYYVKNIDTYYMEMSDYETTTVRFSENTPVVQTYYFKYNRKGILKYLAIDDTKKKKILYVPKGTIKSNFTLDAK